jgi:hypothetical protein
MTRRLTQLACALALVAASSAVLADEGKHDSVPPLHAGDALGLAVFGDGHAAYARARAENATVAATEKPAPPAKIAPEE